MISRGTSLINHHLRVLLEGHFTRFNATSSATLSMILGIGQRQLRNRLNDIIKDGFPVGSNPNIGIWKADRSDPEDMRLGTATLHSHAIAELVRLSRIHKCSMAELIRELQLSLFDAS